MVGCLNGKAGEVRAGGNHAVADDNADGPEMVLNSHPMNLERYFDLRSSIV